MVNQNAPYIHPPEGGGITAPRDDKIKMYILVRDDIPIGKAIVAVAHASLAGYLKWQDFEVVKQWVEGIFYKVVCKVTKEEFEKAKRYWCTHITLTESSLDNQEVVIVFKPMKDTEWPEEFKKYRLYR